MLSENAFLRNLPQALFPTDRIVLEATAYSINALSISYNSIAGRLTERYATDPQSISYADRISCFGQCWSVVDQCHMLIRLLAAFEKGKEEIEYFGQFRRQYFPATQMRNAMDHLHGNARNIARKKGAVNPLFGALSFCVPFFLDGRLERIGDELPIGLNHHVLTAGALTHPGHSFPGPDLATDGYTYPIGPFIFSAFDHSLNITKLLDDVQTIAGVFENVIKPSVERTARRMASEEGADLGALLTPQLALQGITSTIYFSEADAEAAWRQSSATPTG